MEIRATAIVKKVDANGDNRITSNEIKNWFEKTFDQSLEANILARKVDAKRLFDLADAEGNSDGTVTVQELNSYNTDPVVIIRL